jgi:hypothetical protein
MPSSACKPVVPVCDNFSEPAKSTICIIDVEYNICSVLFCGILYFFILIENILWLLFDVSFKL